MSKYQLKAIPEDFKVEEEQTRLPEERGRYVLYKLTKTSLNTLDAIKILARETYQNQKSIGFAGLKDKHAITSQCITVPTQVEKKLEQFVHRQIKLEKIGYTNEPLTLGELKENKFTITIRNLSKETILTPREQMPNYFGKQRFSTHNAQIGKLLFKKEFLKAVKLIDDKKVVEALKQKPSDPIGALKVLSVRHSKIYTNAYQSLLFNKLLSSFIKQVSLGREVQHANHTIFFPKKMPKFNEKYPLIGFETKEQVSSELLKDINELLRKEQITYHDFLIKQVPQLSAMGELRDPVITIKDLIINERESDEINEGKEKCTVSFTLPKASYATIAIESLIESKS